MDNFNNQGFIFVSNNKGNTSVKVDYRGFLFFDDYGLSDTLYKIVDDLIEQFDLKAGKIHFFEKKSLIDFEYDDKYKIFADTDINWVVEDCISKFEKYGLRYVDDFGSLEKIGKLFNPQNLNLNNDSLLRNLILGLMTSCLTNNNYPETAKIHTDFVNENKSEISESYIDLFFKIKTHLEKTTYFIK